MYRFRSIKTFFEHNELEKQEIYFADLPSLNDPMEGFYDLYWKGDVVLWENFFKHYLICFECCVNLSLIKSDEENMTEEDVVVFKSYSSLPTQQYKDRIDKIFSDFFSQKIILQLIDALGNKNNEIEPDELIFILKLIHPIAINSINDSNVKMGLPSIFNRPLPKDYSKIEDIIKLIKKDNSTDEEIYVKKQLFSVSKSILDSIELQQTFNNKKTSPNNKGQFVFLNFPLLYVEKIRKLLYPDSYVACFMDDCSSSVLWSHYAEHHNGIALKFKATLQNKFQTLKSNGIYGVQASKNEPKTKYLHSAQTHRFLKVNYSNIYPRINFFVYIGRLPFAQLEVEWFSNSKGKKSSYIESSFGDIEKWRKEYWRIYEDILTTKLTDWEYENEYRIIITDILNSREEKENRKFRYDFNELEGIVFGMKVSLNDKLKIIEIIVNKCKETGRADFDFFQARYEQNTGKMINDKLSISLDKL